VIEMHGVDSDLLLQQHGSAEHHAEPESRGGESRFGRATVGHDNG